MTYAAFGIHKELVEQDGIDPKTDEYYTELDKRMGKSFLISLLIRRRARNPFRTLLQRQDQVLDVVVGRSLSSLQQDRLR